MTFAAAPALTDLTLGKYLKILSKGIVYNQLSEDTKAWERIKKFRKGPAEGRELRILARTGYGAGAVQFVTPSGGDYPSAHKGSISEGQARFKDYALTVEVERTLIQKAMSDFASYGKPLAEELKIKGVALARMLSAALYQDGTGRLATASGVGTITTGTMVLAINQASTAIGSLNNLMIDDKILVRSTAGAAHVPTGGSGTFAYWLVTDKDRDAGTVTMVSYNTLGAVMANTATIVTDGDYLCKYGATTFNDWTAISTNDYNTISEGYLGFETLGAKDGRVANGFTMSGALAGQHKDCGAAPLQSLHFQQLISQLMIRVGAGRYKYNSALMSFEAYDSICDQREVDRKFADVKDGNRGVEGLGYVHGQNKIIFEPDEFCPKQRIWVIPDADVVQFHGSDFDFVEANQGQKFYLTPSANGGHQRTISAYMEGSGALLTCHPAAIGLIKNFTLA